MHKIRYCVLIAIFCVGISISSGCTTANDLKIKEEGIPPSVQISPPLSLLEVKTIRDKVKIIPDAYGNFHVITYSTKLKKVLHIIVGPEGVMEKKVIQLSIHLTA